jgi:hypothetical protein
MSNRTIPWHELSRHVSLRLISGITTLSKQNLWIILSSF